MNVASSSTARCFSKSGSSQVAGSHASTPKTNPMAPREQLNLAYHISHKEKRDREIRALDRDDVNEEMET